MQNILYLLFISSGALLMLGIFQFTIYLQQNDKAYLHYALYLFVMSVFNVVRILDGRLTDIYPLSVHTVEMLDALLSNFGFLMYVNFLGVVLNITRGDKFFFKSWRIMQVVVTGSLLLYFFLKISNRYEIIAEEVVAVSSLFSLGFGLLMVIRLFRFVKETFYKLIITGTLIVASSVLTGLVLNIFVYNERSSFHGLAIMEIGMLVESVFISAAMGFRLKLAYIEKEKAQQNLLEETRRNEALAKQTAELLRKELDLRNWQNKVSRDLHDDIGATLSSIHVYSSVAAKAMEKDADKAKDALQHINENARLVMENMSDIVWAMKSSDNNEYSVEGKLKNYGYELLTPLGINCLYQIDKSAENKITNMDARKNILLITKEAMNNMAKYSGATEAAVIIKSANEELLLSISDNGKGFKLNGEVTGNGLLHMKQRTESMQGKFSIESGMGNGTIITCRFPLTTISD
jgi:signal transduction histidine kinase